MLPSAKNITCAVNWVGTLDAISNLIVPGCPAQFREAGWIVTTTPGFSNQNYIRVYFPCFFTNTYKCFLINEVGQVETESVDMKTPSSNITPNR